MSQSSYFGLKVWARVYDKRVITEDGIYAEDSVPAEYAGSELEIEFNQIIVFSDSSGSFFEYSIMDYADVKDDQDDEGIGFEYDLYGTSITEDPVGPSDLKVTWYFETYPENFEYPTSVDQMFMRSLTERNIIPKEGE